MPTRKQRRRRQKEQRHEYEYVYVDEEGQEVDVEPEEIANDLRSNGKGPAVQGRGGRKLEPASWARVGKRAVWVGPLMFLTLTLIATDLTLTQRVSQTLLMLALFLPVSYMMDRALYRASVKRGQAGDAKKR